MGVHSIPKELNKQSRPADVFGNAGQIALIATGEIECKGLKQLAKKASSLVITGIGVAYSTEAQCPETAGRVTKARWV